MISEVACFNFSDSSAYAHYVFNTFDQDHNGSISFEVRKWSTYIVILSAFFKNDEKQHTCDVYNIREYRKKPYTNQPWYICQKPLTDLS